MAAVVRAKSKPLSLSENEKSQVKKEGTGGEHGLTAPLLVKFGENESVLVDIEKLQNKKLGSTVTANAAIISPEDMEEREVIGIITLEDVFEELLQVRHYVLHLLVK